MSSAVAVRSTLARAFLGQALRHTSAKHMATPRRAGSRASSGCGCCSPHVRVGSPTSTSRRYLSNDAAGGAPTAAGCPGEGSVRPDEERFVVTGSLLDARKEGSDLPVPGQSLVVSHAFDLEAVKAFAAHAGDDNPIHLDEDYARQAGPRSYDGCIVHGLMVAGLFSTAFGKTIPGALYVSQTLQFERPVLVGERVDVRIEVERVRATSSGREVLVRCSTMAYLANGSVAVSGRAQVLLPRNCEVRSF